MPDEPLHHVLRPAIPWRPGAQRTECGLPAPSYATWTREELFAAARQMGKTRTYMVTCVTCLQTAERHPTWEEDPVRFIGRLVEANRWGRSKDDDLFARELQAMAALVAAHREEFDETVAGLADTTDLAGRRQERARRPRLRSGQR